MERYRLGRWFRRTKLGRLIFGSPFSTFAFPLIAMVSPNLLISDLVSVQPMAAPTGVTFNMRFTKNKTLTRLSTVWYWWPRKLKGRWGFGRCVVLEERRGRYPTLNWVPVDWAEHEAGHVLAR